MFLADADLLRLTGYKRPSDQRNWLERHHVPYFQARSGRPELMDSDEMDIAIDAALAQDTEATRHTGQYLGTRYGARIAS